MSNESMSLYGIFKEWYRSPKYCSNHNYREGVSEEFIITQGFTENHIQELIDAKVIIQRINCEYISYKLTDDAIKDFMAYGDKPKLLLINQ